MSDKTGQEARAWDNLFDNTKVARMCPCPACNHYLPHEADEAKRLGVPQYAPDTECELVTAIKLIAAVARRQALDEAVEPLARGMYLDLMSETRDQWPLWRYAPVDVKAEHRAHAARIVANLRDGGEQ